MSLGKKDIANNISSETSLFKTTSQSILESFIDIIRSNKTKIVKIANFGTFYTHQSPERIGRNPKTKEQFKIHKRKKFMFKASSSVRKELN